MKKYFSLAFVIALASCGNNDSLEGKKQQLEQLKAQYISLETKIKSLEKEISDADTTLAKNLATKGIAVEVKTLAPEIFEHYFEVNAVVEADKNLMISPETGGHIKTISVKEGEKVAQGQVIAVLNTDVLQKNIDEIQNGLELAKTVYERQKKLWEQKIGSEIQYLQAKNNKESLEKKLETLQTQVALSTIKAPVDGIIDIVYQKAGELAGPGIPLVQLVNLEKMLVKADVSEAYAGVVKERDTVELLFPAFAYSVKQPIERVSHIINPGNRSFKVQVSLANKNNMLKPNYVATMKIRDFTESSALVIPSVAVSRDMRGEYVYIVEQSEEKMIAKKTYIKTGKTNQGKTMITDGLKAGQKVITAGNNEVANGNEIRIVNSETAQAAN